MENNLIVSTQNSTCTVDEGKERLNPSREKNKGMHRRRKVDDESCVTPAGTSNELDVQNKWEENTHTHTVYTCIYFHGVFFISSFAAKSNIPPVILVFCYFFAAVEACILLDSRLSASFFCFSFR